MSALTSVDIREVVFVNEQAKHDYESMPPEVLQAADARTTAIQNHLRLPRNQRQALRGKLAGIDEVRVLFDDNTYRVYYLTSFKAAIYILDAGIKKSPRGTEISKPQIDRLIERKKVAVNHYLTNEKWFEARMADRLARRAALQADDDAPTEENTNAVC
jgi:phage-related protein